MSIIQTHNFNSLNFCKLDLPTGRNKYTGSLAPANFTGVFLHLPSSKIVLKYWPHVNFMYYFLSSYIFPYTFFTHDLVYAEWVPSDFYQTQHIRKPRTRCIGLKTIGSLIKLVKTDTVHSFGWWWARLDQELESEFINLAKDNVIQSRSSNRAAGRIKVTTMEWKTFWSLIIIFTICP